MQTEDYTLICDGCGKVIYKASYRIPGTHWCNRPCYESNRHKKDHQGIPPLIEPIESQPSTKAA